ncbi:MAG: alpha/beta hydrolase [Bacteroidia bacterium]|nr:alpha/beta hydrolase [Bacteroidia bacterium]
MTRSICILFLSFLFGFVSAQTSKRPIPEFNVEISGQGPAMILIPGLASSSEVWDDAVDSLEKFYTCHRLTLAGFAGQEAIQVDGGFLPRVKTALIKYIKENKLQKLVLMGHSLGGFLSMGVSSEAPELVEKVIIVDSYPFYSAAMNPMATEESSKAAAEQFKTSMLAMDDSLFEQQQRMTMPVLLAAEDKLETAVQWSLSSDRKTVGQAMYEIMTTDLREEVGNIQCPVLVMGSWAAGKNYGITKEMVKRNYESQFSKTSDLTVVMAESGRHFIMWDEPEWFLEQLIKFVK